MEVDFANPAAGVRWPITKSDLAPHYRRAPPVVDREPSILDVRNAVHSGFVYRPFPGRSGRDNALRTQDRDVLSTSSLVDVAVGTSVLGLDANRSRSAVRALTCFRHASAPRSNWTLDPAQNVVVAGGGISNAELFLQPRADGAVPGRQREWAGGKYLMEHPHLFERGRGGARRRPRSAIAAGRPSGRAVDALFPTIRQMGGTACSGAAYSAANRTTEHPMAEYLAAQYGRPFPLTSAPYGPRWRLRWATRSF